MIFLDSEGEPIPRDINGYTLFDVDLTDWHDGRGPQMSMSIPCFEEIGTDSFYNGCGVLVGSLRDLLEEYADGVLTGDEGDSLPAFAAYLRNYADRLEAIYATRETD